MERVLGKAAVAEALKASLNKLPKPLQSQPAKDLASMLTEQATLKEQ